MIDKELTCLKESIGNKGQFCHQIYDLLFLLFALAAQEDFDLDSEWTKGKEKKRKKYLEK